MTRPIDVATGMTLDFIRPLLPNGGRVLEVGCGRGDLARRLMDTRINVVAIDPDPAAISAAQALGVDARVSDLLDFEDNPFYAVLFTRSLHHIADASAAIRRARALTRADGVVIVEDFDLTAPDDATASWHFQRRTTLQAAADPDDQAPNPNPTASPRAAWLAEHEHHDGPPLHNAAAMQRAISGELAIANIHTGPYLFRSMLGLLADNAAGFNRSQAILQEERDLIASKTIRAVGWRCVARPRPEMTRS